MSSLAGWELTWSFHGPRQFSSVAQRHQKVGHPCNTEWTFIYLSAPRRFSRQWEGPDQSRCKENNWGAPGADDVLEVDRGVHSALRITALKWTFPRWRIVFKRQPQGSWMELSFCWDGRMGSLEDSWSRDHNPVCSPLAPSPSPPRVHWAHSNQAPGWGVEPGWSSLGAGRECKLSSLTVNWLRPRW